MFVVLSIILNRINNGPSWLLYFEIILLGSLSFKWLPFKPGNTRVITQSALQTFQDEMVKVIKDPYKVVMKQTQLPISLLNETAKVDHNC